MSLELASHRLIDVVSLLISRTQAAGILLSKALVLVAEVRRLANWLGSRSHEPSPSQGRRKLRDTDYLIIANATVTKT